ncbi:MAG: hypothetical protein JXR73_19520 [Candidatus Omnitrophica bacterium]|nr:hypothetical protein [Candidatus Omnitrophota bacterium]
MKNRSSQRGMASLSVVMLFVIVAGLLIAAAVSRNLSMARDLHRDLIKKQADWLVESAFERAMLMVENIPDPTALEPQTFHESFAPVFLYEDPLLYDEAQSEFSRVIESVYGFYIEPVKEALNETDVKKSFMIKAYSRAPYRNSFIAKTESRYCFYTSENGWQIQPVVSADL